jgi:hypothetical protein
VLNRTLRFERAVPAAAKPTPQPAFQAEANKTRRYCMHPFFEDSRTRKVPEQRTPRTRHERMGRRSRCPLPVAQGGSTNLRYNSAVKTTNKSNASQTKTCGIQKHISKRTRTPKSGHVSTLRTQSKTKTSNQRHQNAKGGRHRALWLRVFPR